MRAFAHAFKVEQAIGIRHSVSAIFAERDFGARNIRELLIIAAAHDRAVNGITERRAGADLQSVIQTDCFAWREDTHWECQQSCVI